MEARAQAAQKAAAEKAKTPSVTSGDSSLGEGALEGQTAVNDDPAVHTAAQNASIEEYKNSVDPAMAKYVDDVRAGKKLEPFVVSKTGDRMRSAMMELTGLYKVGDYTMLDNNGVMHITNRHAGGDGSADATMKESADVARAAYVLNNFDNAYLAKDRADGYMTSNGKRAPIVLFEKKIDGSHIVVEAVCDTKKNKNFIVSEYLSKNGVDEKEIAKVLRSPVNAAADPEDNVRNVVADPSAMTAPPPQSPMDAVADFRDTSETLAEDHGAEASIAPETARVNEKGVENAGETVETARVNDYADVDRKVDPAGLDAADEGSGQMRETYGLREPSGQTARQSEVQRQLEQWGVESGKTKAAQDISQKLPANVDADRYAAAASTIYHLAQMDEVESFDDALRLAGVMDNTALNVNYILDSGEGGRIALNTAYLYGADTKEQAGGYGGGLTDQSTSGQGLVYYKGTLDHDGTDMGSRIIELNAAATGTDAVLKNVLQNDPNVRAYVESETARIFFGDSVSDIFGTVLHEDYHWYNSLDQAGAKSLQDHALTYLAQMDGYESVDEMIRDKMDVYASQKLTYEQAAEELVADAWRGIFATEADFKRWVEFQRGQAEKNAGVRGSIHKVMNRVKNLLSDIISRAKEVLTIDPSNAAALKAKRLAEAQRRTLQDEYFAHAEKAMDTLRAAIENAAALKTESAAEQQGVRFSIQKDADGESYIKIDEDILKGVSREEWKTVVKQTIKERYPNGFERNGWTILNSKEGRKEFVWSKYTKGLQWENGAAYADKMRMAANLDEIIQIADEVYREPAFHKNAESYNRGKFEIQVGQNFYEADVLTAIKADDREIFYDIVNIKPIEKETSGKAHMESEDSGSSGSEVSEQSIAQNSAESKRTDEPVKKSVRFQMSAPVEVDSQKDLVAVHNLTEGNLREALELGGLPSPSIAVVKAQEGHTQYGPISLVFNSDTIDPMVNRANRIYGSDAWTPTRPNVEYEVHADKAVKLNSELAQLSRQTAGGAFARGNVLSGTLDMEASGKSPKQLAESLSRNDAVKAAYLADKGETVQVVTKQEVRFTESQKKRYEKIMEALGGEAVLRDIVESDVVNGNHDKSNAVLNEVREAEKSWAMEEFGWSEEKAQTKADRLIAPMLRARLENAYEYVTTKDMAGKTVQDTEAMQKELQQKAPDADVEEWLLPKMEGILGKKGIRNEKDPYTRTGNRRSFAQLHNPYTLQNLVEAMNQQNARGEGAWGLSANTLMSTATAEYQNLDEVRADKGRLQQMPAEEYKALLEQADGQIEEVISRIRQETAAHSDSGYGEREILGDILLRAAQGKQTMAAVSKAFSKEGYTISRETAKQIVALYKTIADIPTGYFEAKPQRAVEFDEVRAAIVPDNASAALLDSLKEKGVTVYEYKAGDDAQRTKVLNQVPNVRFQMAEQADRDAKRNRQRQASRTIADNSAAIKTLTEMMGLTRGVRVSDDSILGVAEQLVKASGAKGKADTERVAREMRTLIEYMKTEGADMNKGGAISATPP
nr:MAG TPA: nuclease [Bacteriophage sp.]